MRARCLVLLACALGLLGVERPRGLGDVVDVRHWSYEDYTRVVVELDRSVGQPEVVRLSADRRADRPDRLYVDLDGIWVGRRYGDGIPVQDGLLARVQLLGPVDPEPARPGRTS